MRWRGKRQSRNVEDRRGLSGGGKIAAGGGIGILLILLLSVFTGKDLGALLKLFDTGTPAELRPVSTGTRPDDTTAEMISVVLASTEDIWSAVFREAGSEYHPPGLVIFEGVDRSGCGGASAAMGPFYCPADNKVYIDLSFCQELRDRFQAPGNFAVAYVVAHEVGHHIQNLLGISGQVQAMRDRLSTTEYNKLSVKLELQADFLAGVWAYHARQTTDMIEPGDLEAALRAAHAIGDDKLQQEAQGYVVPDAFTHGSSRQRMYWFKKGFETGDLNQGRFEQIR